MTTYRVRPTKPVAVAGAAFGVVVLTVGVAVWVTRGDDIPLPLMVLWVVFGAATAVFSVWAAFAANGRTQTLLLADDAPFDSASADVEAI